ncbi:MAG: hypothetical protein HY344_04380 [Candidatus Levybacteria bacterium]|nr:hypothetical protein [Candidatus Levybacteria bacterium]
MPERRQGEFKKVRTVSLGTDVVIYFQGPNEKRARVEATVVHKRSTPQEGNPVVYVATTIPRRLVPIGGGTLVRPLIVSSPRMRTA